MDVKKLIKVYEWNISLYKEWFNETYHSHLLMILFCFLLFCFAENISRFGITLSFTNTSSEYCKDKSENGNIKMLFLYSFMPICLSVYISYVFPSSYWERERERDRQRERGTNYSDPDMHKSTEKNILLTFLFQTGSHCILFPLFPPYRYTIFPFSMLVPPLFFFRYRNPRYFGKPINLINKLRCFFLNHVFLK